MATGTLPPFFDQQFFDYSGLTPIVAAGYQLEQYVSGTTTNQDTFTDVGISVPNQHPLTLDGAGRCTMFLDPTKNYTFVLKTPGGSVVKTWNNVTSFTPPISGSYLPLAGGTLAGALNLSNDASSPLQPVTLQQYQAGLAALTATLTSAVAAANAAAAAAAASAAGITPSTFIYDSATSGTATGNPTLSAGNWIVILETTAFRSDPGGTFSDTITQTATVGSTTVSTSFVIGRAGSNGYGRTVYGTRTAVGTLTIATAAATAVSMSAASLGGSTGSGSKLTITKVF